MTIRDFRREFAEEAAELARACYDGERLFSKAMPDIDRVPLMDELWENGLGAAAFDGGKMVGFLCAVGPFENAFRSTYVKGVFSPMGANAAISEGRAKIYAALYEAAGAKWVKTGAVSHGICLYGHDEAAQRQFFNYGFGMRCMDGIREMEEIECAACEGYEFREIFDPEIVYPLDVQLNEHCCTSPFFMNRKQDTREEFLRDAFEDEARYFGAFIGEDICAYMKISATGETFIAAGRDYRHITGAYCLKEHRGRGVYQNLMNFAIRELKKGGYTRLGVDFESINPAGRGFWLKYFSGYTASVVRRIDERILLR